jgi:adenine-specific DNA-methyltransferase
MDKKIELGQVFTLPSVSKLMISLVNNEIKPGHRVLDPCIGPNTFLKDLAEFNLSPYLVGIELDSSLITNTIQTFYANLKRQLILGNFFDYPIEEKFDFIIMNPPYVRQEHLGGKNNKKDIIDFFKDKIPKKSNLYIYFILKSLLHLKKGGKLIAIVYDSWLYSNFGENFKKLLIQDYSLKQIIHFRRKAFDNADVGATIIVLTNDKKKQKNFEYYNYETPESIDSGGFLKLGQPMVFKTEEIYSFHKGYNTGEIDFNNNFFIKIREVVDQPINRGTNAIVNKFFLFNEKPNYNSIKIIKDITSINKMTFTDEFKHLLYINGDKVSKELQNYLNEIKDTVNDNPDKYKSLSARIKSDDTWYKVNLAKPGNLIFNYYIRDNIDFIYNKEIIQSSDNFYNLLITKDFFANFAILNSSFSKIAILKHGRSQGKGLFKIQLYEFKEVPIINIQALSSESVKKLTNLGQKLADCFRENKGEIISEIDITLIKEYNNYNSLNINQHILNEAINNVRQGKINDYTLV